MLLLKREFLGPLLKDILGNWFSGIYFSMLSQSGTQSLLLLRFTGTLKGQLAADTGVIQMILVLHVCTMEEVWALRGFQGKPESPGRDPAQNSKNESQSTVETPGNWR